MDAAGKGENGWRTMRRSTSQRRTFRTCGLRFQYQYAQGWRTVKDRGTFQFGHVMHALAGLIAIRWVKSPDEAEAYFRSKWAAFEHDESLTWTDRAPWAVLRDRGAGLARLMAVELPKVLGRPDPDHLEERITYRPGDGEAEELCIPDFYGPVLSSPGATSEAGGVWKVPGMGVIDFKTSDRRYDETAAELDEQLTDYQLAEESKDRIVDLVGLCVLVYTVKPQIQWLMTPARLQIELDRFIVGAQRVDRQIRAGEFDRNPASCRVMGECPFVPMCYPSQRHRAETELKQTQAGETALVDLDMEG